MGRFQHLGYVAISLSSAETTAKLTSQEYPDPDQPVLYFNIPDSDLIIRLWSGGLESLGQYMFDFFHASARTPTNAPDDHKIFPVVAPGSSAFHGEYVPWEAAWKVAMGADYNSDGNNAGRYSAPEGTRPVLMHPNHENFYFEIPYRNLVFSTPQYGIL